MVLTKYLPEGRAEVAMQAMRYAAMGLVITLAFSLCYWLLTVFGHIDANVSLAIAFIVFSAISYLAHGKFSFRGHGGRDRPHVRGTRFLVVNLVGFALNQLFVWVLVKQLGGPAWWPTVPFILVTPWVTFALHRKWVFS